MVLFCSPADLQLKSLLPQPSKYWDYKSVPSHLAFPFFLKSRFKTYDLKVRIVVITARRK
jgi:hypothetical protein